MTSTMMIDLRCLDLMILPATKMSIDATTAPIGTLPFCYVVDPSGCPDAKASDTYSGAAWRNCDASDTDDQGVAGTLAPLLQNAGVTCRSCCCCCCCC